MNQVVASYQSVKADITSFQIAQQRQNLAVGIGKNQKTPNFLNNQERQIVDDIGISDAALEKLEQAKKLATQLQDYLNYLKGRPLNEPPKLKSPDKNPSVVVAGQSTKLNAKITTGSITEKKLEISANFDKAGKINQLSITKSETTVEFIHTEIILEERGFFALAA